MKESKEEFFAIFDDLTCEYLTDLEGGDDWGGFEMGFDMKREGSAEVEGELRPSAKFSTQSLAVSVAEELREEFLDRDEDVEFSVQKITLTTTVITRGKCERCALVKGTPVVEFVSPRERFLHEAEEVLYKMSNECRTEPEKAEALFAIFESMGNK